MSTVLILLAGGSGYRAESNVPKQFVEINKIPLFIYAIHPFLDYVDTIVVACTNQYVEYAREALKVNIPNKKTLVVNGGNTGLQSAICGFDELVKESIETDIVFIHDAARPFLKKKTIDNCLEKLNNSDYVFSAAKMSESIYDSSVGEVKKKDNLYKIMSPHAFTFSFLKTVVDDARQSEEVTIFNYMVANRYKINTAETDETNYKITTNNELDFAVKLLDKTLVK